MTEVTRHGEKRTRKRLGINRSAVSKQVQKALDEGLFRDQAIGSLRKYLDDIHGQYPASLMAVYNSAIYIFQSKKGKLITMYHLPGKYRKSAQAQSLTKKE